MNAQLSSSSPRVTVIMPIRNEEGFITRSLGAVLSQTYPSDRMQIIVADGMSTDRTREVIRQIQAEHPAHVIEIVDNPGKIVPTGFNAALKCATGDVIVRVDGHTIIAPDYVAECVDALARTGADNVGGRMNAVSKTPFGQAVALATSSPFGVGGARFHYSHDEEWVDTVYMGAWKRDVFNRIGEFDEEFVRNQDDEFNYRLRAAGGRILLTPRIHSEYYNRATPQALWKQYYQYGLYKVRVMQKHPQQMRLRQFVPPAFAAAIFGGALLAPLHRLLRALWFLCIVLYAVANLGASWRVASRAGREHFSRLPLVFLILHMSYGLGFLKGLYRLMRSSRS